MIGLLCQGRGENKAAHRFLLSGEEVELTISYQIFRKKASPSPKIKYWEGNPPSCVEKRLTKIAPSAALIVAYFINLDVKHHTTVVFFKKFLIF
ncbi:MAG: hypothetical protein LBQ54_06230 [Planctomycetaceae bacterium]|jgi:hypothetical protein|nr:hypothetical protein [Planctomycetaceae bacterium]